METETTAASTSEFQLTPQQVNFFETFGFLKIPGLFAEELPRIEQGFEEVFAAEAHERMETFDQLHRHDRRIIIPQFIDKSPDLVWLKTDPRILSMVGSLIGADYEYAESDGNLFDCESSWHPDTYGAPLTQFHVKFSFYLEPLRAESGAIRVIPGTNHNKTPFARMIRNNLADPTAVVDTYGMTDREIPSWPVETDPGDLVLWSFRTVHASFYGGMRRRLFSVSFREPTDRAAA